ncbi:MAG: serine hydrolase domain-containing protein [Candidatus Hodarchaeota archaeon]
MSSGNEFDIQELKAHLDELAAKDEFSGVVLIAKDHKEIFKEAYGYASKRYGIKNKIDTRFNLGSINKIFTRTAILRLAEEGKLGLDDLVGKFLPDFPEAIATKVTINHLLTFRSGMGHYWNQKFILAMAHLRAVDDFIPLFIEDPLSFEPGEKEQYSNSGYVVLGKIIEQVSGMSYFDYIRENIYAKAGMKDSDHYERDDPNAVFATGYTQIDECGRLDRNAPRRENVLRIGSKGSPAGGGYSTVDDLLHFDRALKNNELVGSEYSQKGKRKRSADGEVPPGMTMIAGGATGVSAFLINYLGQGYTAIILSNYDPEYSQVVERKITEMIKNLS